MDEIIFMNYILSICGILLSGYAFYMVFHVLEDWKKVVDLQLKNLYNEVRELKEKKK